MYSRLAAGIIMNLENKIALITGGKRIGATVAVVLAERGVDVAMAYARSRDEAEATADRVRAAGRRAVTVAGDLRQTPAAEALVAETVRALGGVDILINMASMYVQKPFDELQPEDWDAALAVDLRAAFLCARAAVPSMRARGGGRIINISDWTPRSGRPRYRGLLPYYVAKAG